MKTKARKAPAKPARSKKRTMEQAFDHWLLMVTEQPERFRSTVAAVLEAQTQRAKGKPLTYGQTQAATLRTLMSGGTV